MLGGLLRAPGWDTVDEVKANMLGWSTRSFSPQLAHYRFTGRRTALEELRQERPSQLYCGISSGFHVRQVCEAAGEKGLI